MNSWRSAPDVTPFHSQRPDATTRLTAAPFATEAAQAVLNTIGRDEDEREIMMTVLEQLSAIWTGTSAPFAGCNLTEAGISVEQMFRVARRLLARGVITADEAAWLTDQLANCRCRRDRGR